MSKSEMKRTWMLPVLAALVIFGSVSAARENRKKSAPPSAPKNSRSASRSQANSSRATRPTLPSRQTPRPNSSDRQVTNRPSRNAAPGRLATVNRGRGLGNYTRSLPKSDAGRVTRSNAGSGSRVSRKLEIPQSGQTSTPDSSRVVRKETDRSSSPLTTRSLYHYHRDDYPSRRIFYWITWPNCCRPICYSWGPRFTFGFFWPYYHRRFIFVSIGGYWPCYTYRRYYWYGCHPYAWYGYWPPEYVVAGDTYNYYYYSDKPPQSQAVAEAQKELEENPPAEPAEATPADRYFEQAVKAFEAGEYAAAAAKFDKARVLAPDDIILPFAYAQALFADGRYNEAAELLRSALAKSSPDKEGVFYPRGLYRDQAVLQQQIEQLAEKVKQSEFDADLELLLGYHLLGTGKFDEAATHLHSARLSPDNTQAATVLLNLLEKLQKQDDNTTPALQETPSTAPQPQTEGVD